MTLPDIPRLYTALAEVLAVLVYAQAAPPRAAKPVTYAATAGWAAVLGVFLQLTGSVPLAWWLPCMVAAIAWLYLYLWGTREMNLLEAGYSCARAFILAELTASGGKTLPGLSTGLSAVDAKINGLNKSDLLLLAARPGYSTAFGTAAGGSLHGSLRLFVLV